MHRSSAVLLDLRRSLFFDSRNHNRHTLRLRCIEYEKRKLAIPCYKSEARWIRSSHTRDVASYQLPVTSYLITPRCDVSMNRTSSSTSSPSSPSARNFSSACDVFSFDARSTL